MKDFITIAIPKGRILQESVALFGKIGIDCGELLSDTRKLIFESVAQKVDFLCDGRMAAEVLRVLTVTDHAGRGYYPGTLFTAAEAFQGACTAKSTIYSATIAAGLMVGQFAKWLRGLPTERDVMLNLLAAEMSVA